METKKCHGVIILLFHGTFGFSTFFKNQNKIIEKGDFMAFETISVKQMLSFMGKKSTIIVDLREKEDFKREHIMGAINIPYEELEKKIHKLYGYRNIIFYCERGNTSLLAARDMDRKGFHVMTLYGGILGARGKLSIDGRKETR